MTLRTLISKIITGEKAISAVTAWVKFILTMVTVCGVLWTGLQGVKMIMFNKWKMEQQDLEQKQLDSVRWKSFDSFKADVYRFIENQDSVNVELIAGQSKSNNKMNRLQEYMENKAATKKDLQEVYRIFDEKIVEQTVRHTFKLEKIK